MRSTRAVDETRTWRPVLVVASLWVAALAFLAAVPQAGAFNYDHARHRGPTEQASSAANSEPALASGFFATGGYDDRSNSARAFARPGGYRLAPQTLPSALRTGRNADAGVDVYLGVRNGKPVYTGITGNIDARAAQHGARFDQLRQVTTESVTRGQARAIEEALILRNPGFENIRHSISPRHPWYQQSVDWGEAWLRARGL